MNLKELRESKSITQDALAHAIGISVRQYQKYEKGLFIPKLETTKKICEKLNVPMEELYKAVTE